MAEKKNNKRTSYICSSCESFFCAHKLYDCRQRPPLTVLICCCSTTEWPATHPYDRTKILRAPSNHASIEWWSSNRTKKQSNDLFNKSCIVSFMTASWYEQATVIQSDSASRNLFLYDDCHAYAIMQPFFIRIVINHRFGLVGFLVRILFFNAEHPTHW